MSLNMCGVYRLVCVVSGDCYVGASRNIGKRWQVHRAKLRHGNSECSLLQKAWDAHGEGSIILEVLQVSTLLALIADEQRWMDELKPSLNTAKVAGIATNSGRRFTEQHRAKISAARKRSWTPERRTALSKSWTPERREQQSKRTRAINLARWSS
jgi:group I intron endonuclease